jgi:hypothetical protein
VATFRNTAVKNLNTSTATYLTSTSDSTIILSILTCNTNASGSADLTVNMLDSSSVLLSKLASTITVPSDTSFELLANKLILTSGRRIAMLASTSGILDVSISYVEV